MEGLLRWSEEIRLLVGVVIVVSAVILYWQRRKPVKRPSRVTPQHPVPLDGRRRDPPDPQHAVIVHLSLSAPDFGTQGDLEAVHALEDALTEAVSVAGVGELDGHEIGMGTCELFLYGKNADAIVRVIAPIIRESPIGLGAWALKRYGSADDPYALSTRIQFANEPERPN